MGSLLLTSLETNAAVDGIIQSTREKLVVIRFGTVGDPDCMRQDDVLARIAPVVKNFADIYIVDNKKVSGFNVLYELYDPMTIMVCLRFLVSFPLRILSRGRSNADQASLIVLLQ